MTTEVPPPAGRGKVPVGRTAIESYRFVFINLDRFLELGWLPIVAAFAVNMASGVLANVDPREAASVADWVTYITLIAISWAIYAVFAVRWHRFFLLDERESVFSEVFVARNWRFLGYMLLLSFVPMFPMMIGGLVGFGDSLPEAGPQAIETFNWTLIILFGLYILGAPILFFVLFRFSLVLPATAVDRPLTLGEAWRNMRDHTWRFIGCFFLVGIPPVILMLILLAIFGMSLVGGGTTGGAPEPATHLLVTARPTIGVLVASNAVMTIVGFFATAAAVTVLSKFYRHIVGMDAPGSGAHVLAEGP